MQYHIKIAIIVMMEKLTNTDLYFGTRMMTRFVMNRIMELNIASAIQNMG